MTPQNQKKETCQIETNLTENLPTTNRSSTSDLDLINQIQSIFPNLSSTIIQRAITNSEPNKDFNEIVDYLLSTAYQEGEEEEEERLVITDQSTCKYYQKNSSEDVQKTSKRIKSKNQQKLKPTAITLRLNDVLQRDKVHQAQISRALSEQEPPQVFNNAWATGDSQIIYLSKLLAIEPGKINSIYHHKNCNLVLTLEEILNRLETEHLLEISKDPERLDQLVIQSDFLKSVLLSVQDDQILKRLLIVTDLDPGNAYDLWAFLDELHTRHGNLHFNQFFSSSHSSSVDPASPMTKKKLQVSNPDAIALRQSSPSSSSSRQPTMNGSVQQQGSVSDCLAQLGHLRSRQQYLTHKSRMFSSSVDSPGSSSTAQPSIPMNNKRAIQRSIAAVYSEDSRKLYSQIKQWELRLAQSIVHDRQRSRNDPNWVDLHGLTKNQALVITSQSLQEWWARVAHSSRTFNFDCEPLRIITGAGIHSANARPTLRPTIIGLLDREGWKWKFTEGSKAGSLLVTGFKSKS